MCQASTKTPVIPYWNVVPGVRHQQKCKDFLAEIVSRTVGVSKNVRNSLLKLITSAPRQQKHKEFLGQSMIAKQK